MLALYLRAKCYSTYIRYTVDNGHAIFRKNPLFWFPIPPPTKQALLRPLVLVLETAFAVHPWPMDSREKDWFMPHLCPWPFDILEYDGCCTHFSVAERIRDMNSHLMPEPIDAIAAEKRLKYHRWDHQTRRAARRSEDQKRQRRVARAEGKYRYDLCNVTSPALAGLHRHKTTKKRLENTAAGKKIDKNPVKNARADAHIAERTVYCSLCDHATSTQANLNTHHNSQKHQRKVAGPGS